MIGKEVTTTTAAAAASETETVAHPQGQVKGKQESRELHQDHYIVSSLHEQQQQQHFLALSSNGFYLNRHCHWPLLLFPHSPTLLTTPPTH